MGRILTQGGLINGGLINDGHALANGGILRAHAGTGSGSFSGAVAVWEMDDAANGNRADATGRGNTLTDTNANVGSAAGLLGNCAVMTGTGGSATILQIADNADMSLEGTDFSISLWLNRASNTYYGIPFIKGDDGAGGFELKCYYNPPTNNYNLSVGSNNAAVYSVAAGLTGAWHFYVILWTASTTTMQVYTDASAGTPVSLSTSISATNLKVGIGGNAHSGANRWDGSIDQVGIWHRKLSGAEISSLYNSGAGLVYS